VAVFVDEYYKPFIRAIGQRPTTVVVGDNPYIATYLPEADLVLGLHASIAEASNATARHKAAKAFFQRTQLPSRRVQGAAEERNSWAETGRWAELLVPDRAGRSHLSIGRDGILVALGTGWDRERGGGKLLEERDRARRGAA
jgi:hypothetical protein